MWHTLSFFLFAGGWEEYFFACTDGMQKPFPHWIGINRLTLAEKMLQNEQRGANGNNGFVSKSLELHLAKILLWQVNVLFLQRFKPKAKKTLKTDSVLGSVRISKWLFTPFSSSFMLNQLHRSVDMTIPSTFSSVWLGCRVLSWKLMKGCLPAGTMVVQVAATDADDPTYGNSARVVYSIIHGQPYFSVEPKTGMFPIGLQTWWHFFFFFLQTLHIQPVLARHINQK